MKIYLSMSGLPEGNHPAFHAEAALLRSLGNQVCNPADFPPLPTWEENLKRDIPILLRCEGVHLLRGWADSKGATLERHIALSVGIPCFYQAQAQEAPDAPR